MTKRGRPLGAGGTGRQYAPDTRDSLTTNIAIGAFHLFHPLFALAMSGSSSPDYKALFLKEAELRRQAEERNRPTTFPEFIHHCHDLLWRPLRAQTPSRSTTGKISAPIGKRCPIRLLPWTDCEDKQREILPLPATDRRGCTIVIYVTGCVGRPRPTICTPATALYDQTADDTQVRDANQR